MVSHTAGLSDDPEVKFLSTRQAAIYLGMAYNTLRKWRVYGRGPKYHVLRGRTIRYLAEDLDSFAVPRDTKR